MRTLAELYAIYAGSDGIETFILYSELRRLGPAGVIAENLFRAAKSSSRAKVYRGGVPRQGSYRRMAYDRKNWSIDNLSAVLGEHATALGIVWGWAIDPAQRFHRHVLYVDLPTGQVSFHTASRGDGPDYPGEWDGVRNEAPSRICRWIEHLFASAEGTPVRIAEAVHG